VSTFAEIRLSVCLNQNVTLPEFWFSVLSKLVFSVTKLGSTSIPVAERSKASLRPIACWDCESESRWGHGCLSFVSVVCRQVEVSAIGRFLVQRSPTDCNVCVCDPQTSSIRWSWPTLSC
jgi:hypothetical protein